MWVDSSPPESAQMEACDQSGLSGNIPQRSFLSGSPIPAWAALLAARMLSNESRMDVYNVEGSVGMEGALSTEPSTQVVDGGREAELGMILFQLGFN